MHHKKFKFSIYKKSKILLKISKDKNIILTIIPCFVTTLSFPFPSNPIDNLGSPVGRFFKFFTKVPSYLAKLYSYS